MARFQYVCFLYPVNLAIFSFLFQNKGYSWKGRSVDSWSVVFLCVECLCCNPFFSVCQFVSYLTSKVDKACLGDLFALDAFFLERLKNHLRFIWYSSSLSPKFHLLAAVSVYKSCPRVGPGVVLKVWVIDRSLLFRLLTQSTNASLGHKMEYSNKTVSTEHYYL